jgi:glycogen debranching enzyme
MTEHVAPSGPSHLLAASLAAGDQPCVLKHADTFGVFDQHGDITAGGLGEEGLYHEGTRFLSALTLEIEGARPCYLDSAVAPENDLLTITLTNPDLVTSNGVRLPLATIHLALTRFLWRGTMYQQARITNYGRDCVELALGWYFAADYTDIFDVRGPRRPTRGADLEPIVGANRVTLGYDGRDGIRRATHLLFDPQPSIISHSVARYALGLEPRQDVFLRWDVACQNETGLPQPRTFLAARSEAEAEVRRRKTGQCRIETSHDKINSWIARATADLRTLTTDLPTGPYPYAGVPWFNTPFGRDGLIAAWQCLWLQPALARGVLAFLAYTQATEMIPERDAEPGKILHETRRGELAATGDIPFGRYYGSVDGTPLFVALAGAYFERTADLAFVQSIRPSIEAALTWIDQYGDRDGDGFVEYERRSPVGLIHQGWKDSDDAVVHQDGSPATGPIALCEVQGYVYAAWRAAAVLARALEDGDVANKWATRAAELRTRFNEAFWCEELGTYALALDAGKVPCRVRTSNAGHCLFGGIVEPSRAPMVARTLVASDSFSGWGIRTLAVGEACFNPMGYHTGGVWPHDNALIAEGLATYGLNSQAAVILEALFDASLHFDLQRMPELFCGFERRDGEAPIPYPLACAPQAWAAGAVPLLLKASLGLHIDGTRRRITFSNPHLPTWLDTVSIFDLEVNGATIDLSIVRHKEKLSVSLLRGDGSVHVLLR